MIISSATLAGVTRGFRKLYEGGLKAAGEPRIGRYAMRSPSSNADEVYAWLGALPGMRKLVGEVNIRNLVDHGFRVANEEFESTYGVKRADIERDRLAIYSNIFTAMGQTARRHPDKLLHSALVGGFTTDCYTGKKFFDVDHAPQGAKKQKFTNKDTKKLSADNFNAAVASIMSVRDAEGEPVNENPELTLIVSPKNRALGLTILEAQQAANGASNINKGAAKLDVWPRLAANEDMWFLVDLGGVVKPFVWQVEVDTEFAAQDKPDDPEAFLRKRFVYQAYGRYAVAGLVPELAWGSTGADAA